MTSWRHFHRGVWRYDQNILPQYLNGFLWYTRRFRDIQVHQQNRCVMNIGVWRSRKKMRKREEFDCSINAEASSRWPHCLAVPLPWSAEMISCRACDETPSCSLLDGCNRTVVPKKCPEGWSANPEQIAQHEQKMVWKVHERKTYAFLLLDRGGRDERSVKIHHKIQLMPTLAGKPNV